MNLVRKSEKDSFDLCLVSSRSLIDTSSFVLYSYCFKKVEHNSFQSARIDFSNPWYQLTAMPSKDSTNNLATIDIRALVVLIVVVYWLRWILGSPVPSNFYSCGILNLSGSSSLSMHNMSSNQMSSLYPTLTSALSSWASFDSVLASV